MLQRDDVIVLFNEHWDASMELLVAKDVLTSLHGVMYGNTVAYCCIFVILSTFAHRSVPAPLSPRVFLFS